MLPNLMDYTILNIHSSIIHLPILHSSLVDPLKEFQAQTPQTLKEIMHLTGQSTSSMSQELSLEDALNAFRQTVNQPIQELKDATMANT